MKTLAWILLTAVASFACPETLLHGTVYELTSHAKRSVARNAEVNLFTASEVFVTHTDRYGRYRLAATTCENYFYLTAQSDDALFEVVQFVIAADLVDGTRMDLVGIVFDK